MPGLYANKFTIELNDMGRIVFVDQRAPAAESLPMASATAAEIVMTIDNMASLGAALTEMVEKHRRKNKP